MELLKRPRKRKLSGVVVVMHKFIVRLPGGGRAGDKQKPSNPGAPPIKATKSTQMYIDLGQKSFGATQTCKLCNMVFVMDDNLDRKSHEEFCKRRAPTLILPNLLGHTIVRDLKDEQSSVIHVNRKDGLHRTTVEAVLDAICCELGSCKDLVKDSDVIYLLVDKSGTVLGCVVCEKVMVARCAHIKSSEDAALHLVRPSSSYVDSSSSASTACPPTSSGAPAAVYGKKRSLAEQLVTKKKSKSAHSEEGNNEVRGERYPHTDNADSDSSYKNIADAGRTLVGVKLIWVPPAHRRKRVAHTLLDTVRQSFIFGTIVSVSDLVFSQPTEDGFAFASSYCQSDTVFAYA